jgi:hypothetical protein
MHFDTALRGPGARDLLPGHLDRLAASLRHLGDRGRADLARTLAAAAAGLVSDAVATALAPAPPPRTPWAAHNWGSLHKPAFDDPALEDDDDYDLDGGADGWGEAMFAPPPSPNARPRASAAERWSAALAVGLRVAAWWLCRRAGPRSLLPALALGGATTGLALAGGPLALVALGLAEAVFMIVAADGAARLRAAPGD